MREEIQALVQKLKEYGLDDVKIKALFDLAFDEFLDEVKIDIENSDIKDLTDLESHLKQISLDDIMSGKDIALEALKLVYGMQAESKVLTFVKDYFEDAVKQAESVKNMVDKYNAGDPDTVKAVDDAKNGDDYKVLEEMVNTVSSQSE